ncbi:hypothetical protein TNCV_3332941 [Trichonephila clavipes]|nr:hypothetical protein TNCV_3332941 [Trichonephila clavipes]
MPAVTPFRAGERVTSERCVNTSDLMIALSHRTLQVSTETGIKRSAGLSSFRALGADLRVPFTLADRNLLSENLVQPSLSGALGTRPKRPLDEPTLIKRIEYKIRK